MIPVKRQIQKLLQPSRKRPASPDEIRQIALLCRARLGDESARRELVKIILPAIKKNVYGRFAHEILSDSTERVINTFAFATVSDAPNGPMPAYAAVIALRVRKDFEKRYKDDPCQLDVDLRATLDEEAGLVDRIAAEQEIDNMTEDQRKAFQHHLEILARRR